MSLRKRDIAPYDWRLIFLCEPKKVSSKGPSRVPRVTTTLYSHRRGGMSLCTETRSVYLYQKSYTARRQPESGWASIPPRAVSAARAVILDPLRWVHWDPRVYRWCGDERPSCRVKQSRHSADGGRRTQMAMVQFACFEKSSNATHRLHGGRRAADHKATVCPIGTLGTCSRGDQGYTIRRRPHCTRLCGLCGFCRDRRAKDEAVNKNWTTAESKKNLIHTLFSSINKTRDGRWCV